MLHRITLLLVLLLGSAAAWGQLNVVATTTNMAMLAKTVGGEHVEVTTLAPPDRDAHYLDVRPNMMAALRRADIVVSVGAELEIGWLPPAIEGAGNRDIYPERQGYFEAANQVDLIEPQDAADRAMGDVHPRGNPHIYMDPPRMARAGLALAEALADLDEANAESFRRNARDFRGRVDEKVPEWRGKVEGSPGMLLYHEDANYLAELLGVTIHGYLEPVPGVPPTGRHLRDLRDRLVDKEGVLIRTPWQPERAATFVREQLGWPVVVLPTNVKLGGDADDYLALIDEWVQAFAP